MKKYFIIELALIMLSIFIVPSCAQNTPTPKRPMVENQQNCTKFDPNKITEGSLIITGKDLVCPLKHTDVQAYITGFTARVNVTQTFVNPTKESIEAIYIFPLPEDAAVDTMTIKIGDRVIKSRIKEREEAKKIYEKAKNEGKHAALLTEERDNIFTQAIANIMPGEKIEVNIGYTNQLQYTDGIYEFVFPMVVGPRFIPKEEGAKAEKIEYRKEVEQFKKSEAQSGTGWGIDNNRVPDASRITPIVAPPNHRAGHDISISLKIEAPFEISNIKSILHETTVKTIEKSNTKNIVEVDLKDQKTIPNKDFILQYSLGNNKIQDGVLYHVNKTNGGFFSLILQPPTRTLAKEIIPKEMIFVIDTSGSQSGWPLKKSVETMRHCIENMNPNDTFNLISFSNKADKLFPKSQPNNKKNVTAAKNFLDALEGNGGTNMMNAVIEALNAPQDPSRLRIVCFMTDGYVGNDMEILESIQKNIGRSRLFSFGTGNSVNRYLIDKMAEYGHGEAEVVTLKRDGAEAAEAFRKKIANPVLTDITVECEGLEIEELLPKKHMDLFSDRPIMYTGRFKTGGDGTIILRGYQGRKPLVKKIAIHAPNDCADNEVIERIWARNKIDELSSQDLKNIQEGRPTPKSKQEIINTSLQFNILSKFTAFVAVEEKVVNKGGKLKTISTPVELPDGLKYEKIFGTQEAMCCDSAPRASMRKLKGNYRTPPMVTYAAITQSDNSEYAIKKVKTQAEIETEANSKLSEALQNLPANSKETHQICITLKYINSNILGKIKQYGIKIQEFSSNNKIVIGSGNIQQIKEVAKLDVVTKIELLNNK